MRSKTPVNVLHTFETTNGCRCDGKRCFEVLIRKHRKGNEVRYWCDELRGYFDPFTVVCPRKES